MAGPVGVLGGVGDGVGRWGGASAVVALWALWRAVMMAGSCSCSGLFPKCIAGLRVYPDRFLRR